MKQRRSPLSLLNRWVVNVVFVVIVGIAIWAVPVILDLIGYARDYPVYRFTDAHRLQVTLSVLVAGGLVLLEWHRLAHEKSPLTWAMAYEVDEKTTPYGDKDGYGPFTALATFAVAQGAALTAVIKSDDLKWLVLSIYAFAVGFTVKWIAALLRAVKHLPTADPVAGFEKRNGMTTETVRAYDRPTVLFGRFVQGWTISVGLILFFLGMFNLLPNQTSREFFTMPDIPVEVVRTPNLDDQRWAQRLGGGVGVRNFHEAWIALLKPEPGERLVWIEQQTSFKTSFRPFDVDLSCQNLELQFGTVVAFLVSRDPVSDCPVYRQVPFGQDPVKKTATGTIHILNANKDDFLVIVATMKPAIVESKDKDGKPIIKDNKPQIEESEDGKRAVTDDRSISVKLSKK